jgi:F-type H+-transporting ATPase subunit b
MRTLFLISFMLFPGVALASPELPWDKMGLHAANLAILVGALVYFTRGPIKDALANRAGRIRKALEESHQLRKDAQDRFDSLEAKLLHFGQQMEGMKAEATKDADREAAHIATQATADVERIRAATEKAIRDETQSARNQLRREAVELAVKVAEQNLRTRITAEDEARLASDLLGTMKHEVNGHG